MGTQRSGVDAPDSSGDGDGDGNQRKGEIETKENESALEQVIEGGNMANQPLTDNNPTNLPMRIPVTTSTPTIPTRCTQRTCNTIDYRNLHNPATHKLSEHVRTWTENYPGLNSLEPEMQHEVVNFVAEIFTG